MGRSFKVRRKSENLPVIGYILLGTPFRNNTAKWEPLCSRELEHKCGSTAFFMQAGVLFARRLNRRFSRGNGGFFIVMPSRLGPETEGECKGHSPDGRYENDEVTRFVLFDRSFSNSGGC